MYKFLKPKFCFECINWLGDSRSKFIRLLNFVLIFIGKVEFCAEQSWNFYAINEKVNSDMESCNIRVWMALTEQTFSYIRKINYKFIYNNDTLSFSIQC